MKKYINLIIGILAIVNIAYGFWGNQTVGSIFGFEMNIWIYRAVWAAIGLLSFYRFYEQSNSPS